MASLLCSRRHPTWSGDDGDLLAMVALELSGEEDQSAIRQRRVTGRSLAAEECAELAAALRSWVAGSTEVVCRRESSIPPHAARSASRPERKLP